MKYSHDYSKLKRAIYTTIRRNPKGKVGDIVVEKYPSGEHRARIMKVERCELINVPIGVLINDTDLVERERIYELFQSFYEKPINFVDEKFYIYTLERGRIPKYNIFPSNNVDSNRKHKGVRC